jgi:hypothetical protein
MTLREKLVLAGLYLSKFDSLGLSALGFDGFVEAFNVIGFALGSRPASIKNYRDEFDPLFPNPRKGWHKRPTRAYCMKVLQEYEGLDFQAFTRLVKSFFDLDENLSSADASPVLSEETQSAFAQRLITGLAAERYFEAIHSEIPEFKGYRAENTTRYGCGYDFRLQAQSHQADFLAVEVKGLRERVGSLMLTPKEYGVASALKHRFFLFVVRNFRESPEHTIYQDPLSGSLDFRRVERTVVQVSWLVNV